MYGAGKIFLGTSLKSFLSTPSVGFMNIIFIYCYSCIISARGYSWSISFSILCINVSWILILHGNLAHLVEFSTIIFHGRLVSTYMFACAKFQRDKVNNYRPFGWSEKLHLTGNINN